MPLHVIGVIVLIGGIVGYVFLPSFVSLEWAQKACSFVGYRLLPSELHWFTSAMGAFIGFVYGFITVWRILARSRRRTKELEVATEAIGGQFFVSGDPEMNARLTKDFHELDPTIYNVVRKPNLIVGDLSISIPNAPDEAPAYVVQTAAYWSGQDIQFPRFVLQPETLTLKLLANFVGWNKIEQEQNGPFSKAYRLSSADVEETTRLFDKALRQHFASHPGWYVRSTPRNLLVYRPGYLCAPAALKTFISEVEMIFGVFEQSARAIS
jgi:hypothetical protein